MKVVTVSLSDLIQLQFNWKLEISHRVTGWTGSLSVCIQLLEHHTGLSKQPVSRTTHKVKWWTREPCPSPVVSVSHFLSTWCRCVLEQEKHLSGEKVTSWIGRASKWIITAWVIMFQLATTYLTITDAVSFSHPVVVDKMCFRRVK